MTVVVLRLPGLPAEDARQAASTLLDLSAGPPDLRRLLVLDDTALLDAHAPVYQRLITARRVDTLLCIAAGPRTPAATGGKLMLPGNLGGTQGSPVLWVSDPVGIDWRAAASAIAIGHAGGGDTPSSGLERVIDLLSVDAVFDAVHEALCARVPGRVASPGLWLTGADDEAATFTAALAIAITRICTPDTLSRAGGVSRDGAAPGRLPGGRGDTPIVSGSNPWGGSAASQGTEGPFPALAPAASGGASLAPGGPLARYRDEAAESVAAAQAALGKLTGIGGALRRGDGGIGEHLIEAGTALADLRALVDRLLREAHAAGDLTINQRRLVQAAGVRFPADPSSISPSGTPLTSHEASPVFRAVSAAVSGGDPLPLVSRRLTLTERDAKRRGSAIYLPEAEQACPAALLDRLADPPRVPRPSRRAVYAGARAHSVARRDLGLDDAARAAAALTDLVIAVANREWSPSAASPGELARARVAIDGARKALLAGADLAARSRGAGGARLARLADSLAPVLRDLVLRVVAAEISSPSAGGPEAFASAHDRAAALLAEWARLVEAEGVSARPPFTAAVAPGASPETEYLAAGDDVAEVREAVAAQPGQEMWQLCTPDDLSALDVASPPHVVRFAPRLARDSLAGTLPAEVAPVWTSAGSYAGLIRLVPLRPGVVSVRWGEPHLAGPAAEPELRVMADMLAFRGVSGEHVEVMAQVEDAEFPAGEFLMARWVRLDDGTGRGGTRLRQHRVAPGARRGDGYERLDNEILAGRRLHEVADWGSYPAEVARLYGDEASSGDPYSLLEPYHGAPLREVGGYLLDDELADLEVSLLTGLCWLAAAGIAHRAISPDTVLWDSTLRRAQITDFSLSTVFGVPRTPVPGPRSWVAREQRQGTCDGVVGDRDDIWAAGRLIFFARNQGEELMERGQLADRGLAGLLDDVFSPPASRPTADELLRDRLGRPNPVPRVADGLARARAGRDMFLAARARRHPAVPVPPGFGDDLGGAGDVTVAGPARAPSPGQAASPAAPQEAAPSPADVPRPGAPAPGGRGAREAGRTFRWRRGAQ